MRLLRWLVSVAGLIVIGVVVLRFVGGDIATGLVVVAIVAVALLARRPPSTPGGEGGRGTGLEP